MAHREKEFVQKFDTYFIEWPIRALATFFQGGFFGKFNYNY
jgi:hypothetical protein